MVRSLKNVLYHIVTPDQKFNDERFFNLFLDVESIMNCRPRTYLSLDSAESKVLTPYHFLLDTSLGRKPIFPFDDTDMYV